MFGALLGGFATLLMLGMQMNANARANQAAKEASDISKRNLGRSDAALAWNQHVQRINWKREDTAVQRRVQDLKAAGLNPMLAAGQGAASALGSPLQPPQQSMEGPRMKMSGAQLKAMQIATVLQAGQQMAGVGKTMAETMLLKKRAEKESLTVDIMGQTRKSEVTLKAMQAKLAQLTVKGKVDQVKLKNENMRVQNELIKRRIELEKININRTKLKEIEERYYHELIESNFMHGYPRHAVRWMAQLLAGEAVLYNLNFARDRDWPYGSQIGDIMKAIERMLGALGNRDMPSGEDLDVNPDDVMIQDVADPLGVLKY